LTIFGIALQNSMADALCFFIGRPFNIRLMYRKVTDRLGSLVATGLGADAGIESLGRALDLPGRAKPAVAARITSAVGRRTGAAERERERNDD
jgi:hypothetical protein